MTPYDLAFRWAERKDESWCRECDPTIPEIRLQRKIDHREILLALCDDRLAGYLRLEYLWQKLPFVGLVEILQPFRRQGIGTAMLAYLADFLLAQGHDRVLSSSMPDNHAGQQWHLNQGFSVCGELRGINPGDRNEIFFLKPLTKSEF